MSTASRRTGSTTSGSAPHCDRRSPSRRRASPWGNCISRCAISRAAVAAASPASALPARRWASATKTRATGSNRSCSVTRAFSAASISASVAGAHTAGSRLDPGEQDPCQQRLPAVLVHVGQAGHEVRDEHHGSGFGRRPRRERPDVADGVVVLRPCRPERAPDHAATRPRRTGRGARRSSSGAPGTPLWRPGRTVRGALPTAPADTRPMRCSRWRCDPRTDLARSC